MEKIDTKVRDNTAEENYLDTIPLTEEELTKYIDADIAEKTKHTESDLSTSAKNLPPDLYIKEIPNIIGDLRKKLVGSTVKRIITTLAAYGMYFGVGAGELKAENLDADLLSRTTIGNTMAASETSDADGAYILEGGTGPDPEDPDDSLEKGPKPNVHKIEYETPFLMGSAELPADIQKKLEAESLEFVDSFSSKELEDIKYGKMIVKVSAGSSEHIVRGEQETMGQKYTNNYELAQIRANEMVKIIKSVLSGKGIVNPMVIVDIANVDGLERGVSETGERFAKIEVMELSYENIADNYDSIIIDPSSSMKNDKEAVDKLSGLRADIITMETKNAPNGDVLEFILKTVSDTVDSAPEGASIAVVFDEGDNSLLSNKETAELRDKIVAKNINVTAIMINPENPSERIFFDLKDMLFAVKDLGGSKGDINTYNLTKRIQEIRINKITK